MAKLNIVLYEPEQDYVPVPELAFTLWVSWDFHYPVNIPKEPD